MCPQSQPTVMSMQVIEIRPASLYIFFMNISDNSIFFSVLVLKLSDNSIADQSDSMETQPTDDVQLSSNLPAEQPETKPASVSDAALQDGERKAQLQGTPKQSRFLRVQVSFLCPLGPRSSTVRTAETFAHGHFQAKLGI